MRTIVYRALAFSAALIVAACAGTPQAPYHARGTGDSGFYDEKLAANKYFILYTDTKRASLENFVRLRAAEVAVAEGFSNFVVLRSGVRRGNQIETNFRPWSEIGTSAQITSNVNNYIPKDIDQIRYSIYDAYGEVELLTAEQARGRQGALDARTVIASGGA